MDGLLEGFEALRGLVVNESLGPAEDVAERLAALVPLQVGLSRGVVGSVDWELFRGGHSSYDFSSTLLFLQLSLKLYSRPSPLN